MAVSNYSDVRPGDPEVQVRLVAEGDKVATGFIQVRQQRDGVWEAYVDYSYMADNGFTSHRRCWFAMDDLTVLTIDDVPQGGYVNPPRPSAS